MLRTRRFLPGVDLHLLLLDVSESFWEMMVQMD